ncbi:MAG TPA: 16S rRNA (cytidine(1402)-2'-O)-methyltransferase [Gammaproteobacteria bacterium]|nr:16S rRNA (cytidine(1402)-2'-O)-methyltransferase [Gammaproteobacteria bacterium]
MSIKLPEHGVLYVVATPIGNLADLSERARRTLAGVALVAAEDTRRTRTLLQHCGLSTALISVHEHNETERARLLVARLEQGESVALVSDAGTPLISDPGYRVVRAVIAAGFRVLPVPGPSAVIAGLSVSGLATDRFTFEGFLPARGGARRTRLARLAGESRSMVFYESPHRLAVTLEDMARAFGAGRSAFVGRELTKAFEQHYHGPLGELAERFAREADSVRGELVICVAGRDDAQEGGAPPTVDPEQLLTVLLDELPLKRAVAAATRILGGGRNELYSLALRLHAER